MSDKEKHKKTEKPADKGAAKDAVGAAEGSGRMKEEGKQGKLDYVFKIVPVDPKNSFDFEDVADK